jgi:hypothetical protein
MFCVRYANTRHRFEIPCLSNYDGVLVLLLLVGQVDADNVDTDMIVSVNYADGLSQNVLAVLPDLQVYTSR